MGAPVSPTGQTRGLKAHRTLASGWQSHPYKQEDEMGSWTDYRQALCDGRRGWIMGEGLIDDVTTHPATRAMVDEYVAWYDLHFEAAWQDIALRPRGARCEPVCRAAQPPLRRTRQRGAPLAQPGHAGN